MKFGYVSLTALLMVGCQAVPSQQQFSTQTLLESQPMVEAESRLNQIDFRQLKQQEKRPVIALVLGSGGARGYAHIGVIEVLEQYGIHPDFIVGSSAGSIVGSIYASGKNAQQLREIAMNMKANDVRDVTLDLKGFFDGKKVENYVNAQVDQLRLEQFKTPMVIS